MSTTTPRDIRNRARETFHSMTVPDGLWTIVRVDGRGFSKLTEAHYAKPVDDGFADLMVDTTMSLVSEFGAIYGYTESDEISILFPLDFDVFARSVEKIVSLTAAHASATFSVAAGRPASFDSRIWTGASFADVIDYFQWRQSDAERAALNNYCYWTLRQHEHTARAATSVLAGATRSQKHELLAGYGIDFTTIPAWHRSGFGIHWETFDHLGVDPRTETFVPTTRRRLTHLDGHPSSDFSFADWLRTLAALDIMRGTPRQSVL